MTNQGSVARAKDHLERPGDKELVLYLGGIHASAEPLAMRTLLGSCIAVCLFDPVGRVGGMNHFMLPSGTRRGEDDAARFGVHAMDLLLRAMHKAGAHRRRLVAKVFGGAHVLDMAENTSSVPTRNIEFIRAYLPTEGIPVAAEDVGGYRPRIIRFHTHAGQVLVRSVAGEQLWQRLLAREAQGSACRPNYGSITLFGD